jgi:hypothetical protein
MTSWTVYHERIPEIVVPGKRLGRHVRRDSRSLAYPYQRTGQTLSSQLWTRHIPILNQGNVGSCTGNAETGALGTDPLNISMPPGVVLDETMALRLYSAAETIDGDGPYPPNDNGSTGSSACQAADNLGLISGYTHCAALNDVLDALQAGPVILGMNWYSSFDSPSSSGLVSISPNASVRGGHEVVTRGIDITAQTIFLDNSWDTSWGLKGSFTMSWTTLDRLMSEQGDGTVSVPLTAPAPVPVPVNDPDITLWQQVQLWAAQRRMRPDLVKLQGSLKTWAHAKGYNG